MNTYHVDLGSWDRGRTVEIQADTLEEVLDLANEKLKEGEHVVEIFLGKRILWDYFNGALR